MRFPSFSVLAGICLLGAASISSAAPKVVVGVALPRAQLGQANGASADVAEPVRQALMAYLKGPAIEVVSLEARIPQQISAEAKERGCTYVLYSDVTQTAKRSGLGLLKKLAPVAGAIPMLGGGGMGSMGTQVAMQAMAQGAMQSQMQEAQEDAMASAMAAINGAQKNNLKAGDSLTFQYQLVKTGTEAPLKADKIVAKAKANGDDLLSPMIENVAIAVVGAATGG